MFRRGLLAALLLLIPGPIAAQWFFGTGGGGFEEELPGVEALAWSTEFTDVNGWAGIDTSACALSSGTLALSASSSGTATCIYDGAQAIGGQVTQRDQWAIVCNGAGADLRYFGPQMRRPSGDAAFDEFSYVVRIGATFDVFLRVCNGNLNDGDCDTLRSGTALGVAPVAGDCLGLAVAGEGIDTEFAIWQIPTASAPSTGALPSTWPGADICVTDDATVNNGKLTSFCSGALVLAWDQSPDTPQDQGYPATAQFAVGISSGTTASRAVENAWAGTLGAPSFAISNLIAAPSSCTVGVDCSSITLFISTAGGIGSFNTVVDCDASDGTGASDATKTGSGSTFSMIGACAYVTEGTYTITACVTDTDDSSVACDTVDVVVTDPSPGLSISPATLQGSTVSGSGTPVGYGDFTLTHTGDVGSDDIVFDTLALSAINDCTAAVQSPDNAWISLDTSDCSLGISAGASCTVSITESVDIDDCDTGTLWSATMTAEDTSLSISETADVELAVNSGQAGTGCDCATSQTSPYCVAQAGETISHTSPRGRTVSVTLGAYQGATNYTCGKYATGDTWVMGIGSPRAVKVDSTTPTYTGVRHGYDTDPDNSGGNSFGANPGSTLALPSLTSAFTTAAGPVSFTKFYSRSITNSGNFPCSGNDSDGLTSPPEDGIRDRRSCANTIMTVTFVDAIPDSDGDLSTADEFRPSPNGGSKITANLDAAMDARAAAFGGYASSLACNYASITTRYQVPEVPYAMTTATGGTGNYSWYMPIDEIVTSGIGGISNSYGSAVVGNYAGPVACFMDSDFDWNNATHRQAFIHYIQTGIDLGGGVYGGSACYDGQTAACGYTGNGAGGHIQGPQLPIVFAAYFTGNANLVSAASDGTKYLQNVAVYQGSDGLPYWGTEGAGFPAGTVNGAVHWKNKSTRMDSICWTSGGPTHPNKTNPDGTKVVSNYSSYNMRWAMTSYAFAQAIGDGSLFGNDLYLYRACTWQEGGLTGSHTGGFWCGGAGAGDVSGNANSLGNVSYGSGDATTFWAGAKSNFLTGGACNAPPY